MNICVLVYCDYWTYLYFDVSREWLLRYEWMCMARVAILWLKLLAFKLVILRWLRRALVHIDWTKSVNYTEIAPNNLNNMNQIITFIFISPPTVQGMELCACFWHRCLSTKLVTHTSKIVWLYTCCFLCLLVLNRTVHFKKSSFLVHTW